MKDVIIKVIGWLQKYRKILTVFLLVVIAILTGWFVYSNWLMPQKKIEKEKIAVGIIAQDQKTADRYQAFVDYLNKHSDDQWVLISLKDYGSFITQINMGQIKAGFMGSMVGYQMIKDNIGMPVARGEKDGVSTYNSYIFTRKDSSLDKIEDLKDKKFALVDAYTSAGYLFPAYLVKKMGKEPEDFFQVVSFLGSHDKAILAVLNGEFDGGAVKDSAWRKLAKENLLIEKELQVIDRGGPFPEQTFVISHEFGQKEVKELKELMLEMERTDEGRSYLAKIGYDRFIPTAEKDFAEVKKLMEGL